MLDFKILLSIYLTSNMVYGRPVHDITETGDIPETQTSHEFPNPTASKSDPLEPSEVQKAVCTVISGDVRASAEAFTTRELKGVCGSTEMLNAFRALENKLSLELENIQKLLQNLHHQFVHQNTVEQKYNESSGNKKSETSAIFKFQTIPGENKQQKPIELNKNYYMNPLLKSLPAKERANIRTTTAHENEVSKYNITNKTYTYYWRMENFTKSIKSINSLTKDSPIFSIRGKAFKIKAHFQHLHRDYLYLQLEDCSLSPQLSLGNSIILDTGSIFKEISSENFKYKMSILDQNKKRSSDLVSQEFDNLETGFSIPNSALIDSSFIKDDTLLIQLFIYL